jgi:hypothetical protein
MNIVRGISGRSRAFVVWGYCSSCLRRAVKMKVDDFESLVSASPSDTE